MHRLLLILNQMTLRLHRKLDRELGTAGFIGSYPDVTPVIFDDLVHDSESQASSILLRGKIGFKNPGSHLRWHTTAVIRDLQIDNPSRAVITGSDFDLAVFFYSRHRIVQ